MSLRHRKPVATPLDNYAKRLSNFIPLPGVSEMQGLARGFINRLKDVDGEWDERIALETQLERLIGCVADIDDPSELNAQLVGIQRRFQENDAQRSRFGIREAENKLKIWEELKSSLDEALKIHTVQMMARTYKDLSGLKLTIARDHEAQSTTIARIQKDLAELTLSIPREQKSSPRQLIKTIPCYEITSQVKIPRRIWPGYSTNRLIEPSTPVEIGLRAGRYGNSSVTYKTFVAESPSAAHEVSKYMRKYPLIHILSRATRKLVEKELDYISQSIHLNVAQLVGVTEGCRGLNGIIVVTNGIDLDDFVSKFHSGSVWAKFITGFEDLLESKSAPVYAERITVAPDGHFTVFPWAPIDSRDGGIRVNLSTFQYGTDPYRMDHTAKLLMDIYMHNHNLVGPKHMRTFVDSLNKLGRAFTELQVMQIANFCKLFPLCNTDHFVYMLGPERDLELGQVGMFVQLTRLNGRSSVRRLLQSSRHIRQTDLYDISMGDVEDRQGSPKLNPKRSTSYSFKGLNGSYRFCWEDIFTEAQEISQRLNIDLNTIAFCDYAIRWIKRGQHECGDCLKCIMAEYYGHHSYSISCDCKHALVAPLRIGETRGFVHGWTRVFKMRDDWGRRYEAELNQSMESIPGSYPT